MLPHESIADEVLAAVAEQVWAIKVGHPLRESSQLGPVIGRALAGLSIFLE